MFTEQRTQQLMILLKKLTSRVDKLEISLEEIKKPKLEVSQKIRKQAKARSKQLQQSTKEKEPMETQDDDFAAPD